MTGYAEGECDGPRAERSLVQARADLRQRAAARGAEHVRVLGVGPLANRGHCQDDAFRVTGVPYVQATDSEASERQTADDQAAETETTTQDAGTLPKPDRRPTSSAERSAGTADKLAELEELREKDLISEQEYQRLRERVLDDAF